MFNYTLNGHLIIILFGGWLGYCMISDDRPGFHNPGWISNAGFTSRYDAEAPLKLRPGM
jgi:hypothetical protein